jgi:uncharacterized coiled-coil protein SlyX
MQNQIAALTFVLSTTIRYLLGLKNATGFVQLELMIRIVLKYLILTLMENEGRIVSVKVMKTLWLMVLISGLGVAQSSNGPASGSENMGSDVQQLREAVAAQNKAMAEQQKQLTEQRQEIEKLKQQLDTQAAVKPANENAQPGHVVNASLTTPAANPAASTVSAVVQEQERPKESPLSFRIGNADFTPGGFMDFTALFRSTNVGSLGTNFFAIPFNNQIQGHLTETRFTAQNSRVNMKVAEKFGRNDVTGFFEMDFLGNDAANVFVTSNSHTMRMRHYFVDYKRDKWEILGGQVWSWMTPNRVGLSPYSQDVFYSQDMDFNYQAGLTWARAPQFRVAYHPNSNWALGVAFENPQQFIGQTVNGVPEVTFPAGLNAQLGPQFDGANNSNTPNFHPDIVPKITFDTDLGGKHFHVEGVGLVTSVRDAVITPANPTFVHNTKTGFGGEFNMNLEVFKNFRLIANSFYSDGGGRYIFGMGPQAVVLPDGTISLVHSASTTDGFEYQFTKSSMLYGYYGGGYFQRNAFVDTTAGGGGKIIGFGGLNSPSNANRAIQEGTIGWVQTFWKKPQYGALQLITQYSYLTRSPWFVAPGAPKNAHLGMGWADLRFILP